MQRALTSHACMVIGVAYRCELVVPARGVVMEEYSSQSCQTSDGKVTGPRDTRGLSVQEAAVV